MHKSVNMLPLIILILGISLTLSSEVWMGMWMGLEVSVMAFIPIMYRSNDKLSSESCMIYFLIQSMGSILMLISVLSNSLTINPYMVEELFNLMLMMSMLIKLGMPPYHFWFLEVLDKLDWTCCLMMMTGQKIAPFAIMASMLEEVSLSPMFAVLATAVGAIGGLNQTSIRKILGYSSVNNMGWVLMCMMYDEEYWMYYWMIYSLLLAMMTITFDDYSSYWISQFSNQSLSFLDKSSVIILFMSLGGLPPFIGFLPKWIALESMMMNDSYDIMIVMLLFEVMVLFYYLRIASSILLFHNTSTKWLHFENTNYMSVISLFVNLSLPIVGTYSF